MKEIIIKAFETAESWRAWLEKNQEQQEGVWMQVFKTNSGVSSIKITEALDEALCFGWIDGQRKSHDELSYLQKYTPRRSKSIWSKRNIGLVENLIKAGKMTARGFVEIERAKADGRWERAYDSHTTMQDDEELLKELVKDTVTKEFYDTLNKSNKFAINFRLQTAKKPETKAKRMREILQILKEGRSISL